MPEVNLRVQGHILTRNTAISSYGWDIKALDGNDQRALEAKSRLEKAINKLISKHALTHVYGHQVWNVRWFNDQFGQTPELSESDYTLYECHNSVFYKINGNNKAQLQENANLLLDASTSYYTNGGIMLSALLTEVLRLDALREQSNFIKKIKGILQVVNKGGAGEEQTAAENAARTAIENNYLVTSDLIEFKLNQIVSGQTPFRDILSEFNADIAIGFLGQANTSELPNNGGSRAALEVLKSISADVAYSDIIHFNNFINSQLIKYDYQLNYGDGIPAYKFEVNDIDDIDRESGANAANAMLQTGQPYLKAEWYKIQGMSVPKPGDDIIQQVGLT